MRRFITAIAMAMIASSVFMSSVQASEEGAMPVVYAQGNVFFNGDDDDRNEPIPESGRGRED
jgi:hypothetical protein